MMREWGRRRPTVRRAPFGPIGQYPSANRPFLLGTPGRLAGVARRFLEAVFQWNVRVASGTGQRGGMAFSRVCAAADLALAGHRPKRRSPRNAFAIAADRDSRFPVHRIRGSNLAGIQFARRGHIGRVAGEAALAVKRTQEGCTARSRPTSRRSRRSASSSARPAARRTGAANGEGPLPRGHRGACCAQRVGPPGPRLRRRSPRLPPGSGDRTGPCATVRPALAAITTTPA